MKFTTPAIPRPDLFRYPKSARLTRGAEFSRVRREGRRAGGKFLSLSGLLATPGCPARFGVVAPKRIGSASERNRVKRRLREIIRHHRARVAPGWWVVSLARADAVHAGFDELQAEWLLLASRLSILAPDS